MSRSTFAILIALLTAAMLTGAATAATWVRADGDFPEEDWITVAWKSPLDSGDSSADFAFTVAHGGNPDGLRSMGISLGDGPDDGAMCVQLNVGWAFDPATDGPIVEIDGGFDFVKYNSGPSRIALAVLQYGKIFVHVLNPMAADTVWTRYNNPVLTEDDFEPIDPTESGQPDFSASGAPMTFGFAAGQVQPQAGELRSFYPYVDNVVLIMTTGPVSSVGPRTAGILQPPIAAPNPFNPATIISFEMPKFGPASVRVYDLAGRLVKELAARDFDAGPQALTWRGEDSTGRAVSSGVFMVVLETRDGAVSRRITLAK